MKVGTALPIVVGIGATTRPDLIEVSPDHLSACHFAQDMFDGTREAVS